MSTHPHGDTRHHDAHQHGATRHHDDTHIDWNEMFPQLELGAALQVPLYRQAVTWLGELVPAAGVRRVLDIGSGPGVLSCLLAEAFPYAEVVAVDATPELLERARQRAASLGVRVTTVEAELPDGIGTLGEADLIWAANSLHHLGDQGEALSRLGGLLRPGGLLALSEGGLPTRHLPHNIGIGRPGLEARVEAVFSGWFTDMRAALPGARDEVDDWRALLAGAGLAPSGTRSFLHDLPAPVTEAVREHAVSTFSWARDALGDRLDPEDRNTLDRLLDPAEPRGLHHRPDLYTLAVRTVHTARRG
ncbi:class I SAM-dependent methyltransferase [Streptomyces sp. SP18CS02]|uniref:class I SAM-dependent methyltransferase n=1 Tax=Streptomyces sp. SP18CS02 TaxID=3002531 RepID=UPI002E767B90|nr:class I SAM-dependent methyltransferase [Streptomyces sp. SP18CS02]MEE1753961.1 class I SAM-dependent methyltransferase [Streptomyces sp. SP18CS02]